MNRRTMLQRIGAAGLVATGLSTGTASATTLDDLDLEDTDEVTIRFTDGREDRTIPVDELYNQDDFHPSYCCTDCDPDSCDCKYPDHPCKYCDC